MKDVRTDLPSPSSPNFEQRVRETLMTYLGRQGNPLDRGLTLRDLVENGIVKIRDGYNIRPGMPTLPIEPAQPPEELDLTPPPQPTGFVVNSAISHVFIEHDAPTYRQGGGHLRTRVYGITLNPGDPLPVFDDAVEITQFTGTVHAHPSNPSTTWRLWIKWETRAGVLSVSPAGGTNGLEVRTGEDVALLIEALTGNNPPQPFIFVPAPTVVNGVNVPSGTYIKDGFIQNGTITNAKIANLAVDNAKIANAAIDTAKIADAAITTAKITDASITTAKIATAAITNALIADASITTAKIADATITSAKIVSLDAAKISATSLSAISANAGTITAGVLRSADNKFVIDLTNKTITIEV